MNRIWNSCVSLVFVLALSGGLVAQPLIAAPQVLVDEESDGEDESDVEDEGGESTSFAVRALATGAVAFGIGIAIKYYMQMQVRAQNGDARGGGVAALGLAGAGLANNMMAGDHGIGGGKDLPQAPVQSQVVDVVGTPGVLVKEKVREEAVVVDDEPFGLGWLESDEETTKPKASHDVLTASVRQSPAPVFLDFLPEVDPNAEDDEEFPTWMTPIVPSANEEDGPSNNNGPREEPPVVFTPTLGATPGTGLRNHSFRVVVGPRDSMEFVRRVNSQGEMDAVEEAVPGDADATQFQLEGDDSIRAYIEALFNSPIPAAQRPEIAPALYGTEVVVAIEDDSALEREVIEMLRTPDPHGARLELVEPTVAGLHNLEPVVVVTMDIEKVEVVAAPAPSEVPVARTARKTARKPTRGDLEIIRQTGLTTAKRTRGKKEKDDLAEVKKDLFN